MTQIQKCPICSRELGHKFISKHHLIPKSKGGRYDKTVMLHNICHQKIHSVFTELQLKKDYNTIEKLITHEEIAKFIKWIAKKDIDFYDFNKSMNR